MLSAYAPDRKTGEPTMFLPCEREIAKVNDYAVSKMGSITSVLEMLRVVTEAIAAGDWVPRAAILFAFFGAEEQVSQQRVLAR